MELFLILHHMQQVACIYMVDDEMKWRKVNAGSHCELLV